MRNPAVFLVLFVFLALLLIGCRNLPEQSSTGDETVLTGTGDAALVYEHQVFSETMPAAATPTESSAALIRPSETAESTASSFRTVPDISFLLREPSGLKAI